MKFIPVDQARKLEFNTPVFVRIDNDPTPAVGRMLEMKQTKDGVVRVFELTTFSEDYYEKGRMIASKDDNEPPILLVPFTTDKVTHVAIP